MFLTCLDMLGVINPTLASWNISSYLSSRELFSTFRSPGKSTFERVPLLKEKTYFRTSSRWCPKVPVILIFQSPQSSSQDSPTKSNLSSCIEIKRSSKSISERTGSRIHIIQFPRRSRDHLNPLPMVGYCGSP